MGEAPADILDMFVQAENLLNDENKRSALRCSRRSIISRHDAISDRHVDHAMTYALGIGMDGPVAATSDFCICLVPSIVVAVGAPRNAPNKKPITRVPAPTWCRPPPPQPAARPVPPHRTGAEADCRRRPPP